MNGPYYESEDNVLFDGNNLVASRFSLSQRVRLGMRPTAPEPAPHRIALNSGEELHGFLKSASKDRVTDLHIRAPSTSIATHYLFLELANARGFPHLRKLTLQGLNFSLTDFRAKHFPNIVSLTIDPLAPSFDSCAGVLAPFPNLAELDTPPLSSHALHKVFGVEMRSRWPNLRKARVTARVSDTNPWLPRFTGLRHLELHVLRNADQEEPLMITGDYHQSTTLKSLTIMGDFTLCTVAWLFGDGEDKDHWSIKGNQGSIVSVPVKEEQETFPELESLFLLGAASESHVPNIPESYLPLLPSRLTFLQLAWIDVEMVKCILKHPPDTLSHLVIAKVRSRPDLPLLQVVDMAALRNCLSTLETDGASWEAVNPHSTQLPFPGDLNLSTIVLLLDGGSGMLLSNLVYASLHTLRNLCVHGVGDVGEGLNTVMKHVPTLSVLRVLTDTWRPGVVALIKTCMRRLPSFPELHGMLLTIAFLKAFLRLPVEGRTALRDIEVLHEGNECPNLNFFASDSKCNFTNIETITVWMRTPDPTNVNLLAPTLTQDFLLEDFNRKVSHLRARVPSMRRIQVTLQMLEGEGTKLNRNIVKRHYAVDAGEW